MVAVETAPWLGSTTEPATIALSDCCPKLLNVASRNIMLNTTPAKPLFVFMKYPPGFNFGPKASRRLVGWPIPNVCPRMPGRHLPFSNSCFFFAIRYALRGPRQIAKQPCCVGLPFWMQGREVDSTSEVSLFLRRVCACGATRAQGPIDVF